MKSNIVAVNSEGRGMSEAMAMAETIGAEHGLEKKSLLHLRLLSEELFGMLRGIAGKVEANFWLEANDRSFEIHMKSDVTLTQEMRDQFLAASSSGKNDAARGFMGKIRVMIANALLSLKETMPYAMINAAASYYPMGGYAYEDAACLWTMADYKEDVYRHVSESKEASEAWDELEKSIVANIADDIRVRITGKTVEMTVCKAF